MVILDESVQQGYGTVTLLRVSNASMPVHTLSTEVDWNVPVPGTFYLQACI